MHYGDSNYDFVASAADQLEVCLGNIRLIAGLMIEEGEQDGAELNAIQQKADHLLNVTANLSDFARFSRTEEVQLDRSSMVLSEVIEQAIEALTPLAATHLRMFVFTVGVGEPAILGDYRKLLPAISGLLRRALEIAVPAAQILISERTTSNSLRLEIDVPVNARSSRMEAGANADDVPTEELNLATLLAARPFEMHHGSLRTLRSERHMRFVAELPLSRE